MKRFRRSKGRNADARAAPYKQDCVITPSDIQSRGCDVTCLSMLSNYLVYNYCERIIDNIEFNYR